MNPMSSISWSKTMTPDYVRQHYNGGWQTAAYNVNSERIGGSTQYAASNMARGQHRTIPTLTCARCREEISPITGHQLIGVSTYHPSCAIVARARQKPSQVRASAPAVTPQPTVLCRIGGIALPHDQPCLIVDVEGRSESEQWASGCFDRSIARGPYVLKLDHQQQIEGRWWVVGSEARELRWTFDLYDTAVNRGIKRDIASGAIARCSIEFKKEPVVDRLVRGTRVIDEATLTAISILRNAQPAWYGTSVRVL